MSDISPEAVEVPKAVETPPDAPAQKPKQFLLVADEFTMAVMSKIMPGMLFVEVQGMAMKDNDTHMLLVNPKAVPAAPPVATTAAVTDEPEKSA